MRVCTLVTRDHRDRGVPPGLLLPMRPAAHRPRTMYRVRIRNRADAVAANKAGLPVHLLDPKVTAAWGFPNASPSLLVVAREVASAIDTDLPIEVFEATEAARSPGLEDLVVVLLRRDPLLARAFALRHRDFLDAGRLLKRVFQENVEEAASKVRLQSIVPGLPPTGDPLPEIELLRQDRNAAVEGRL